MTSVKQNPFRVLDLFANTSEREILREVRRINSFIDIGREVQSKNSFPLLGSVVRSTETVEKSLSAIEQPKEKIIQALFWFVNISESDKEAFDALSKGDFDRAMTIWQTLISGDEVDETNYSAFANLSTILLWEACERESFDLLAFEESMELRGQLLSSESFKNFAELVGFRQLKSVEDEVIPAYLETLEKYLEPFLNKSLGLTASDLSNALSSFPGTASSAILENVVEKPLAVVEDEVRRAKESLQSDEWDADNIGLDLFERTRKELVALKTAFGESNFRFTMIVNEVAGTLLNCSIAFFNQYRDRVEIDPGPGSLLLLDYATSLRPGDEVRERIRVNEPVIREWIAGSAGRKRLRNVRENAQNIYRLRSERENISSSGEAFKFLDDCDIDLYRIEKELGSSDAEYLRFADFVINHAISASIEGVNRKQGNLNNLAEQSEAAGIQNNPFLFQKAREAFDIYKSELKLADKVISRARMIPCGEAMMGRVNQNGDVLRQLLSSVSDFGTTAPKRPSAALKEREVVAQTRKSISALGRHGSDGDIDDEIGDLRLEEEEQEPWSPTSKRYFLFFLLIFVALLIAAVFS